MALSYWQSAGGRIGYFVDKCFQPALGRVKLVGRLFTIGNRASVLDRVKRTKYSLYTREARVWEKGGAVTESVLHLNVT